MKKNIFLVLSLCFTTLAAFAQSDSGMPVWEDYCPAKFLNAKTVTTEEYQSMQRFKFVPPTKKQVSNYNKAVDYWNDRKIKFEKFVQVCSNFPEDKKAQCFERIDERETRLNEELEKLHKKQLKSSTNNTTPASIYMDRTNPLRNMMLYQGSSGI